MKKLCMLSLLIALVFSGCNKIPKKSVFERLSQEELAEAIKSDEEFAKFYEDVRSILDTHEMSDVKKAIYRDVTWRRMFKFHKFWEDTTYWNPLHEENRKEWASKFENDRQKADSILNYWKNYLAENALDKYVKIELARINKEYYEYIDGLREVDLGFRLTPLQGTVEQICFNYGYRPKIDDDGYYPKRNCCSATPFSSPTVRYWEVSSAYENDFAGRNVETFLRDFNLYVEVTQIRKDGANINIDDLNIPEEISKCLEYENNSSIFELYLEDLTQELVNKDYVNELSYLAGECDKLAKRKDEICYKFLHDLRGWTWSED